MKHHVVRKDLSLVFEKMVQQGKDNPDKSLRIISINEQLLNFCYQNHHGQVADAEEDIMVEDLEGDVENFQRGGPAGERQGIPIGNEIEEIKEF